MVALEQGRELGGSRAFDEDEFDIPVLRAGDIVHGVTEFRKRSRWPEPGDYQRRVNTSLQEASLKPITEKYVSQSWRCHGAHDSRLTMVIGQGHPCTVHRANGGRRHHCAKVAVGGRRQSVRAVQRRQSSE